MRTTERQDELRGLVAQGVLLAEGAVGPDRGYGRGVVRVLAAHPAKDASLRLQDDAAGVLAR